MKTLLSLLLTFATISVWAGDKATIQQMKGKKAIIRFDEDIPFSVGQQIYINSGEGGEIGVLAGQRNMLERQNTIFFGAGISSKKSKVSGGSETKTEETTASVRFGWNKREYEYGVIGALGNAKQGSLKTSNFEVGGYFEYNLIPNIIGEDLIYGPFAEVTVGNETDITDEKYSPVAITAGAFGKWFYLSPVLAFRADVSYQTEKAGKRTSQGFVLGAGLNHYF